MLSLESARQRILDAITPLPPTTVSVLEAGGRILGRPILSPVDLPGFDSSAMDGYAVRSSDVKLASASSPVKLRLNGRVAAGGVFPGHLPPGGCVRVFTGSPIPAGADAVVMQEDTVRQDESGDTVEILDPVKPWENFRFRGEDVKAGARLIEPGVKINAVRLQLLSAVGLDQLEVGAVPSVGILATGDELCLPGQPLTPGKVFESNRAGLSLLVTQAGGRPDLRTPVADDPAATMTALRTAFETSDVVVSAGGVSVGELDFVKGAFERLGGRLDLWQVAIKPGKPFAFGLLDGKPFFGLPGNPVSALVAFVLLVRPALLKLQGASEIFPPGIPAELAEPLVNTGNRRHFVRVQRGPDGKVRSAGLQASHRMKSLADSDGLVDIPPATTLPTGSRVEIIPWQAA